jgi:hypothetical protein
MSDELTKEAAKEMMKPFADLLLKLTGPLADEVGGTIGEAVSYYRLKLRIKLFQKTQRMLKDAGINAQAVPPRLFLPIIESGSIEGDEDLHSRWAALLANAARSGDSVHPSFIEVLRQLSPEDAQLLDKHHASLSRYGREVTPWGGPISMAELEKRTKAGENPEKSFQNLVRLGLIEIEYKFDNSRAIEMKIAGVGKAKVSPSTDSHNVFTDFAIEFVEACRAPKAAAIRARRDSRID